MDNIEDDIGEDKECRSKDKMDEKSFLKTLPNGKNILGSKMDESPYIHGKAIVNGCLSSIINTRSLRV